MVHHMNDSEYIEKLQTELDAVRERAEAAEQRITELILELRRVTSTQKDVSSPSNGCTGDPRV